MILCFTCSPDFPENKMLKPFIVRLIIRAGQSDKWKAYFSWGLEADSVKSTTHLYLVYYGTEAVITFWSNKGGGVLFKRFDHFPEVSWI